MNTSFLKVLTKGLVGYSGICYDRWEGRIFSSDSNDIHVYKYPDKDWRNISVYGDCPSGIFESMPSGKIIQQPGMGGHGLFCSKIKLIREYSLQEIIDNITDSEWIFCYCYYVKNIPEMAKKITDPKWQYKYCADVSNDREIGNKIQVNPWMDAYKFMNEFMNNLK